MLDLIDFEVGRLRSSMISSRTSSASKFSIGEAAATTTQTFRRQANSTADGDRDRQTYLLTRDQTHDGQLLSRLRSCCPEFGCCRGFVKRVVSEFVSRWVFEFVCGHVWGAEIHLPRHGPAKVNNVGLHFACSTVRVRVIPLGISPVRANFWAPSAPLSPDIAQEA